MEIPNMSIDTDAARRRLLQFLNERCGVPREVLLSDAIRLAARAAEDDVATTLDVTPEGLVLCEVAPGVSAREVQERTEPTLKVSIEAFEPYLDPA